MRRMALVALLGVVTPAWAAQTVLPEVPTAVELSNRQMNRVVCKAGPIRDVFYSREQPVVEKHKGRNAFVKFKMRKVGEEITYAEKPAEFHVLCGGAVYTLIGKPKKRLAAIVHLSGPPKKAEQVIAEYGALEWEEQVVALVEAAYHDDAAALDKFSVDKSAGEAALNGEYEGLAIAKRRAIRAKGIGLRLSEYTVRAEKDGIELAETDFLVPAAGANIAGVTVEPKKLDAGETARLFVVERVTGNE